MSARVVPIPPALHWDVTRETLGEDALLPIIENDLRDKNITYKGLKVLGSEKVAISEPPYIIWISDISLLGDTGRWIYRIDAFTGRIIGKTDARIE